MALVLTGLLAGCVSGDRVGEMPLRSVALRDFAGRYRIGPESRTQTRLELAGGVLSVLADAEAIEIRVTDTGELSVDGVLYLPGKDFVFEDSQVRFREKRRAKHEEATGLGPGAGALGNLSWESLHWVWFLDARHRLVELHENHVYGAILIGFPFPYVRKRVETWVFERLELGESDTPVPAVLRPSPEASSPCP